MSHAADQIDPTARDDYADLAAFEVTVLAAERTLAEKLAFLHHRATIGDLDALTRGARHTGGEGAKFWLHVLTEIKNRGVADVCIVVCDGLTGLPDAIQATWSQAPTQTCVLHLLRNSFRYASRKDWSAIAKDLKPIYTAATEAAALERFREFAAIWERRYPAIVKLWENAWEEFTPFLRFDPEIRTIIYTTNSIESLNARFRRAVRARGHFPNEQAALKCLFLTIISLDPTGVGRQRWTNRWKPAMNAFAIAFPGRIIPTTK